MAIGHGELEVQDASRRADVRSNKADYLIVRCYGHQSSGSTIYLRPLVGQIVPFRIIAILSVEVDHSTFRECSELPRIGDRRQVFVGHSDAHRFGVAQFAVANC